MMKTLAAVSGEHQHQDVKLRHNYCGIFENGLHQTGKAKSSNTTKNDNPSNTGAGGKKRYSNIGAAFQVSKDDSAAKLSLYSMKDEEANDDEEVIISDSETEHSESSEVTGLCLMSPKELVQLDMQQSFISIDETIITVEDVNVSEKRPAAKAVLETLQEKEEGQEEDINPPQKQFSQGCSSLLGQVAKAMDMNKVAAVEPGKILEKLKSPSIRIKSGTGSQDMRKSESFGQTRRSANMDQSHSENQTEMLAVEHEQVMGTEMPLMVEKLKSFAIRRKSGTGSQSISQSESFGQTRRSANMDLSQSDSQTEMPLVVEKLKSFVIRRKSGMGSQNTSQSECFGQTRRSPNMDLSLPDYQTEMPAMEPGKVLEKLKMSSIGCTSDAGSEYMSKSESFGQARQSTSMNGSQLENPTEVQRAISHLASADPPRRSNNSMDDSGSVLPALIPVLRSEGVSKSESLKQVRRNKSGSGLSQLEKQVEARRATNSTFRDEGTVISDPMSACQQLRKSSNGKSGAGRRSISKSESFGRTRRSSGNMDDSDNLAQSRRRAEPMTDASARSHRSIKERQPSFRRSRVNSSTNMGRISQSENHSQVRRSTMPNSSWDEDDTVFSEVDWSETSASERRSSNDLNAMGNGTSSKSRTTRSPKLTLSPSSSNNHLSNSNVQSTRRASIPTPDTCLQIVADHPRSTRLSRTSLPGGTEDMSYNTPTSRRSVRRNRTFSTGTTTEDPLSADGTPTSRRSVRRNRTFTAGATTDNGGFPVSAKDSPADNDRTSTKQSRTSAAGIQISANDTPAGTGRRRRPSEKSTKANTTPQKKDRIRRSFSQHKPASNRNLMQVPSSQGSSMHRRTSRRDLDHSSSHDTNDNRNSGDNNSITSSSKTQNKKTGLDGEKLSRTLDDAFGSGPPTRTNAADPFRDTHTPGIKRAPPGRGLRVAKSVATTQVLQAVSDDFDHMVISRKKNSH